MRKKGYNWSYSWNVLWHSLQTGQHLDVKTDLAVIANKFS